MTNPTGPTDSHDSSELTVDNPLTLPGFFSRLQAGDLVAGVCQDCSTRLLPPRPYCYACGSGRVKPEAQPLTGTIYSFTEVVRPPDGFTSDAPYTLAVVELDSGARLTGRVDAPYEDVRIDHSVRVRIRDAPGGETALPYEESWPLPLFELLDR